MKKITTACFTALLFIITAQACKKDASTMAQPDASTTTTTKVNSNMLNASVNNSGAVTTTTTTTATATADYLIIGRAGGFAGGVMGDYYRVSANDFRKDTSLKTPPQSIDGFNFNVLLPQADLSQVNGIRSSVPDELIKGGNGTYGQVWPDAGYLEVWAGVGSANYHWYFQADMTNVSPDIQEFVNTVKVVFKY